jgi:hypothetical protein
MREVNPCVGVSTAGIYGEVLVESLGDLIQEHIDGAIRRGVNGDRAMALIHSSLRQVLA